MIDSLSQGIGTGLAIHKLVPDACVTIFTEKLSPDTTADGAAGIYGLYLMGNTPLDQQVTSDESS